MICDYIFNQYESKLDRTNPQIYLKAKNEVITAKEKLFNSSNDGLDKIKILFDLNDGESFETSLSIDEINSLLIIRSMYDILVNVVNDSIVNSKIGNEIYPQMNVVLVGGSSNINLFQNRISSYFNNEMKNYNNLIIKSLNSNTVSIGCYLYGTIIMNNWEFTIDNNNNYLIPHLVESPPTTITTPKATTITPIIKTRKSLDKNNNKSSKIDINEVNISIKAFDINPPSLYNVNSKMNDNNNKSNMKLRKSPPSFSSSSSKSKIDNNSKSNKSSKSNVYFFNNCSLIYVYYL